MKEQIKKQIEMYQRLLLTVHSDSSTTQYSQGFDDGMAQAYKFAISRLEFLLELED